MKRREREMGRKISALVAIAAFVVGVAVFGAPWVSYGGIITDITVTNSTHTGASAYTGGTAGNTWVFSSITIPDGQALILTQNQANIQTGTAGFNFDTTDPAPGQGNYTITIGGIALTDLNILNNGGTDDNSAITNESHNWTLISGAGIACGAGHICDVYTGYADTLHSGACKDGGDCLPSVGGSGPLSDWKGSAGVFQFIGNGSDLPAGFTGTHCSTAAANCFDSGAIMIVERVIPKVPEPSTLFLLGAGLMGVAAYGRRLLKKNS